MKKLFISVLIGLFVVALLPQIASAQFGKNMVIKGISWKIYESSHFLIHYYFPNKNDWAKEEEYIQDMVRWTETAYKQISEEINYEMPVDNPKHGKPRIFFYWSRNDADHHPLGPGGAVAYAEPLQMREICVSKESPDEKIQQIVMHETTHLFQFSLWNLAKKSPSQLAKQWYSFLTFIFEGYSQHTSKLHRTEPDARLVLRYWVLNDGLRYINIKDWAHPALSGAYEICYVVAPYLFDYIKETYGRIGFENFVKEFRRAKPNVRGFEKVVTQVLKTDFAELDRNFRKYLEDQYKHFPIEKKEAFEYGRDILVQRSLLKPKRKVDNAYESVISPSGDLIAAFIVRKERVRVALISRKDGTIVKELTGGYSFYKYGLMPIINLHGPGKSLSFSPDGDYVLYFAQTANKNPVLVILEVVTKKVKKIRIELNDVESPEMSSDGKTVIFSANLGGQRDIFSLNLETQEIKNLTNDKQFDYAPSFSPDNKTIVYVTNVKGYKKLFTFNIETLEKKQLTFGCSNEIRPIYSKDGKTIFFISNQDQDKTDNIYSFNIKSGKFTQWTDVVNAIHSVIPMKDKELLVGAVGYRDSRHPFSYNLYEVNLDAIEPTVFADDLLKAKKVETAKKSEIKTEKIDPEKIKKYNPWKNIYLANAMFYGGTSTRLGIYGMGSATLTDLTRTKYIQAQIMQFGQYYKHNTLSYFDFSRRLELGAILSYEDHYSYPWFVSWGYNPYEQPAMDKVMYELRFKRTALNAIAQYPLDIFHRIEFSLAGTSVKYQHPDWQSYADYYETEIEMTLNNPLYQLLPSEILEDHIEYLVNGKEESELRADFLKQYINDGSFLTFNIALVRDTAMYKRFGPFVNDMYRVDLGWSTGGHNARISVEGRKYYRLGSEWVFALRGYGGLQLGKTINPWIIGGLGELRGYDWMQFMGNRIWMVNAELRFPLVKNFNLMGFLYVGDIRVALFMDMANIWFDNERFNALNKDDVNSGTVKGSIGADLTLGTIPILGMPLHLAFSKRMTKIKFLPKLEEDWQIKLYFGFSF